MYVMNISSPACGLAGELSSPGEGALPSRAWEGGAEKVADNLIREGACTHPAPADHAMGDLDLEGVRHQYFLLPGTP